MVKERMVPRVWFVGSSVETAPQIEQSYRNVLALLDALAAAERILSPLAPNPRQTLAHLIDHAPTRVREDVVPAARLGELPVDPCADAPIVHVIGYGENGFELNQLKIVNGV